MANRALVGMQELRTKLKEINSLGGTKRHILVTNRGQVAAVIVPLDWYQEAAERLGDPLDIVVPATQAR